MFFGCLLRFRIAAAFIGCIGRFCRIALVCYPRNSQICEFVEFGSLSQDIGVPSEKTQAAFSKSPICAFLGKQNSRYPRIAHTSF